ncbi:MAG: type II secretion system F family protein [Rhodocyclaceae bacterium]|nr:type II secretion system F family protein [Rhodocyclaceae bacterium]
MRERASRQLDSATRQLATLLGAGIPLAQALQTLARSETGALRPVLDQVRRDVESGLTLEKALARHPQVFDALYRSLVAAGELGGLLDTMLERIASHRERADRLRGKVRSALVYPAAVLTVAMLSVGVILVWVVPGFQALFDRAGADLPVPTRVVVALSETLLGHGLWVGLALAVAASLFVRKWRASTALQLRTEAWLLRLPLLGTVLADAASARWCRTLGMLLGAGVPLDDALGTVARVAGQHRLEAATRNLRRETALGQRLASGMARSACFPTLAVQMAHVGEESGALDALLGKAAESLEQAVEETVARMTTLLEPAIMLVLGVVMGGVIIALYLPVFQLGSAIV